MAQIRESGYQVIDANTRHVWYESYGPSAEMDCMTVARNNRIGNYRIVAVTRATTVADADIVEAQRVAALLTGATVAPGVMREGTVMADDVERDGYNLGAALAKIIAPGGTADSGALINLGMFFSELRGYRDLRTGNSYVSAFVRGFEDNTAGAPAPTGRRLGSGSADKSSETD